VAQKFSRAPAQTGAVQRMKESNSKGVATHAGPESWVLVGNDADQALTGESAGRVLSREIFGLWLHAQVSGTPTRWENAEGNTGSIATARWTLVPRGLGPRARTDAPRTGAGRSHNRLLQYGQAASGSPKG
jgi:hypothetical protein